MDPNIKWDLSNTLPQWPQWIEEDPVEMLFNRTEMGVPIFELKKTSERLQNRCEWVLATFLYWIVWLIVVLGFGRVLVQLLDSRRSVRFLRLVWLNWPRDILSFAKLISGQFWPWPAYIYRQRFTRSQVSDGTLRACHCAIQRQGLLGRHNLASEDSRLSLPWEKRVAQNRSLTNLPITYFWWLRMLSRNLISLLVFRGNLTHWTGWSPLYLIILNTFSHWLSSIKVHQDHTFIIKLSRTCLEITTLTIVITRLLLYVSIEILWNKAIRVAQQWR